MPRILLLEDDSRIAKAIATRLKSAGYEVQHAPDPVMGTMLASVHKPDLILADIWMPIMQGFTFVRRLQSFGLHAVPVIFLTASKAPGLRDKAQALGAAGYLEKPFQSEELLALVSSTLNSPPNRDFPAPQAQTSTSHPLPP